MAKTKTATPECLTCSVPEAAAVLGMSRSAGYQAAKDGLIPTIRFGKLVRVPKAGLQRLLEKSGCLPDKAA